MVGLRLAACRGASGPSLPCRAAALLRVPTAWPAWLPRNSCHHHDHYYLLLLLPLLPPLLLRAPTAELATLAARAVRV